MGEPIEFDCVECGEHDRIDSTSLNFITSSTSLNRDEALLCDGCLDDALEGLYLDLSIGGSHTRSKEFDADREKRQSDAEKVAQAKEREEIRIYDTYLDDDPDEGKIEVAAIDMPSEAKADLKQCNWQLTKYEYDDNRRCWRVKKSAVEMVVDELRRQGWDVDVEI